MDLIHQIKNQSLTHINNNTNNPLTKKPLNVKLNFLQDDNSNINNSPKIEIETSIIEETKIKTLNMIILDENNNILTKKYKLFVNLNKKITKLPFNLDPYQVNFYSISDLSKQILNKLKINNNKDINHYENLSFTSNVGFYDENFKKILNDDDILNDNINTIICKLEILRPEENTESSNRKENSHNDLSNKNKIKKNIYTEKSALTPSNKKSLRFVNNSEKKLEQFSDKNKGSAAKISNEIYNRDLSLNDYTKEEKVNFLDKLKDDEKQVNSKNHQILEEKEKQNNYFSKDINIIDQPNARNKENKLNRSDSDSYSYTLTNRSFYDKIKPKNVEILIRDSVKNSKRNVTCTTKSNLGFSKKYLDFQNTIEDNSSKSNKNADYASFSFKNPNNHSFKLVDKTMRGISNDFNKNLIRTEDNFPNKNVNFQNNLKSAIKKEDLSEKIPTDNVKIRSSLTNLNSEIAKNIIESENVKLPTILSNTPKYNETQKSGNQEYTSEKPKFLNFFDYKKEAKSLFSLLSKKLKIINQNTQTSPKHPLKPPNNNLQENYADLNFLPKINQNNTKSVIFNSLYKSFQEKELKTVNLKNNKNHYPKLSLSGVDNNTLFLKNSVKSNNFIRNSNNEIKNRNYKNYRAGKIYPAKIMIKNYEKIEDSETNYDFSEIKAKYPHSNSNVDQNITPLKKLKGTNSPKENSRSNSIRISKSIEYINKRITKSNKKVHLQIRVLKNILDIENKEIQINKSNLSLSPDKDRVNIDEFNEKSNRSSQKTLSKYSSIIKSAANKNSKTLFSKVNKQSQSDLEEQEIKTKKLSKNDPFVNKTKYNKKYSIKGIDNNIYNNLSVSESTSCLNKSLISDYDLDLKISLRREMCSEAEKNKIGCRLSCDNRTRNLNYNSINKTNLGNSRNFMNNLTKPNNFSYEVNLCTREGKNYENYYVNLYEETQKIKFKIDNFIKNDITKLISNEVLEERFKGVVCHERSEFDYQIKREFLFYGFISSKFEERINLKKSSRGNFSLPIPGGGSKIVHVGITTISVKINRKESEINYDLFKRCKNNYLKLIQEYNHVIEDVLNRIKKNITEILRFFSNLNCLRINKMYIDFQFTMIYILRNENIFSDGKITYKLLEYLTKENNYRIDYNVFYKLRLFSFEDINNLSKEKYYKQANFIKSFLKYYLGDESQKQNITRKIEEFKSSLGIKDFDLGFLISEDKSDMNKNSNINNIRIKVANVYLSLMNLIS